MGDQDRAVQSLPDDRRRARGRRRPGATTSRSTPATTTTSSLDLLTPFPVDRSAARTVLAGSTAGCSASGRVDASRGSAARARRRTRARWASLGSALARGSGGTHRRQRRHLRRRPRLPRLHSWNSRSVYAVRDCSTAPGVSIRTSSSQGVRLKRLIAYTDFTPSSTTTISCARTLRGGSPDSVVRRRGDLQPT